MKQKVIKILEPYRDKTLSFGCEVKVNAWEGSAIVQGMTNEHWYCLVFTKAFPRIGKLKICKKKEIEIIGHPLSHAKLLRALGEVGHLVYYNRGDELQIGVMDKDDEFSQVMWGATPQKYINIPLNHRTIEDIPEQDPMWEQLLEVLSK